MLQNFIVNTILRNSTNSPSASVVMTLVPSKSDWYVSDNFGIVMEGMLPFFMLLMFILPVYRLISNVVSEK